MNVRVAFEELFCTPKSSVENLSLRTSRYSNCLSKFCSLCRTFIAEYDSQEEFEQLGSSWRHTANPEDTMLTSAEVTDLMLELILHMTRETVRLEACRFHGQLPN